MIMSVTDFTDSIVLKIFTRNDQLQELLDGGLAKGAFLKIKGVTTIDKFDSELTIGSVVGIKKIADFTVHACRHQPGEAGGAALPYEDERYGWRLRCQGYRKTRQEVGTCTAIWPSRTTAVSRLSRTPTMRLRQGSDPFKIIYGVEAYLVDDLKDSWWRTPKDQSLDDTYVVFDIETTGLSARIRTRSSRSVPSRWWTERSRTNSAPSSIRRCRSRLRLSS